jgi:uncharacterized protein (TIRG00374 family)
MPKERRFALGRSILLISVGILVFLLYLYFFVPLDEVVKAVQQADPFYFLLALGSLFLSMVLYSLTWQCLLNLLSVKTSFTKVFQFVWVENFVNLIIPAEPIGGDVSKIYLMTKESGENSGKVGASVVGHRILTSFVTIGGLIISTTYFAVRHTLPSLALEFVTIVIGSSIICICLLLFLSLRKESSERLLNRLINLLTRILRGRVQLEHFRKEAVELLDTLYNGILTLGGNKRGLILPFFFAVFAWILDVLTAILVLLSLSPIGTAISLSGIVIVYSISNAIQYIPIGIVPGEVGIAEIVMTSLFILLGNSQAIAVLAAATVLIRVLTFWVRLFFGGLVVQYLGIKSLTRSVD